MNPFGFSDLDYAQQMQMLGYAFLRSSEDSHLVRTVAVGYFDALHAMLGGKK